jgi:two-component system, NtrC family, response regulator GlrR
VFQQARPRASRAGRATLAAQSVASVAKGAVSYAEGRRRVLEAFERQYLEELLARHGHNISAAAAEAGMARMTIYRLLKRLGIRAG